MQLVLVTLVVLGMYGSSLASPDSHQIIILNPSAASVNVTANYQAALAVRTFKPSAAMKSQVYRGLFNPQNHIVNTCLLYAAIATLNVLKRSSPYFKHMRMCLQTYRKAIIKRSSAVIRTVISSMRLKIYSRLFQMQMSPWTEVLHFPLFRYGEYMNTHHQPMMILHHYLQFLSATKQLPAA